MMNETDLARNTRKAKNRNTQNKIHSCHTCEYDARAIGDVGRFRDVIKRMAWLILGLSKHNYGGQDQGERHEHNENSKNSYVDPGVLEKYQKRLLHLPSRHFLFCLVIFLL
jgi:hypothetical protein